MLDNIRSASNTLVIRILLGIIVFAFASWGIKDVLLSKSNQNIVIFTEAKNITEKEFLKTKSEEVSIIQKQHQINLSEEDIKRLGLDQIVLRKLINEKILNYIVNYYHLDLSDETLIFLIKQLPYFKNETGGFDIKVFKSFLNNTYQSEEQYLKKTKEKMLKDILISVFLETFNTPEIMIDNIVNHLAEKREVDLIESDLQTPIKIIDVPSPTDDQLKEYYQTHKELFTTPERRSFNYILISEENMEKKLNFSEDELLNFYNEKKEDFGNKKFEDIKNDLISAFKKQKFDELIIEIAKNLEDEIAAGSSIKDIAEKNEFTILNKENLSFDEIIKADSELSIAAESIFELNQGEVSYPLDLPEKKGLMIVEITSIKPSILEEVEKVKTNVKEHWVRQWIEDSNFKALENIAKNYNPNSLNQNDLKISGLKINSTFEVGRTELEEKSTTLPPELLRAIFQITPGNSTPVFRNRNKLYFAYIKGSKIDEASIKKIKTSSQENISTTIKNGLMDELLNSFIKMNKMKVNKNAVISE